VDDFDYIIVGSGIAGLYASLLARAHGSVLLLTKGSIEESNTRWAQGGIAAAIGEDDSPELHLEDTLRAGAGLVDEAAARVLVENGPEAISDLVRLGVPFDTEGGEIVLGREGAHTVNRVVHAGGDSTGAHIELSLSQLARMSRITILENAQAIDLLLDGGSVAGLSVLDTSAETVRQYRGRFNVLATGGLGQLYRVTTNPAVATGDGIAMAYRAGAEVSDMEFFQFHPTALRLPGAPVFLISEAVRGEGGLLRNEDGEAFMPRYHELADLAPRDIVARAILTELEDSESDHVYLDVTHLESAKVRARFPQIHRHCLDHGLDITEQPIPVSPAAHYMMGGVRADTWGRTTLPGLYAIGECANTGVHGANRLASNSLLETVVFARRAVASTLAGTNQPLAPAEEPFAEPQSVDVQSIAEEPLSRSGLQEMMWREVGIIRSEDSLGRASAALAAAPVASAPRRRQDVEMRNLLTCGRLVATAARVRTESRGGHYRSDFPESSGEWRRHIVFRRSSSAHAVEPRASIVA
jgi:L-aspartate oxidase